MKHSKGQCLIFLESRLPCEDCDLEGHSATCGWHRDWHKCDCGAFDKEGIKVNEDTEFVKKKGIRSKHLKECSWYEDDTTCDCDLFSPLGIYAPYIPLQISKIEITNDRESK